MNTDLNDSFYSILYLYFDFFLFISFSKRKSIRLYLASRHYAIKPLLKIRGPFQKSEKKVEKVIA